MFVYTFVYPKANCQVKNPQHSPSFSNKKRQDMNKENPTYMKKVLGFALGV